MEQKGPQRERAGTAGIIRGGAPYFMYYVYLNLIFDIMPMARIPELGEGFDAVLTAIGNGTKIYRYGDILKMKVREVIEDDRDYTKTDIYLRLVEINLKSMTAQFDPKYPVPAHVSEVSDFLIKEGYTIDP